MAEGKTNKMIAVDLGVSERTIRFHFENICKKRIAKRRGKAVAIARNMGVLAG